MLVTWVTDLWMMKGGSLHNQGAGQICLAPILPGYRYQLNRSDDVRTIIAQQFFGSGSNSVQGGV